MNTPALILGAFGLVCDMVGVAGLYWSTLKDLTQIRMPNFSYQKRLAERAGGEPIDQTFREFDNSINRWIAETNQSNAEIRKASRKWFFLIAIGFTCQFGSAIWQVFTTLCR